MFSSIQNLPVAIDLPEGTLRQTSWGYMTIEVGQAHKDFSPESLLGPQANRCQCPHWGYVLKGRMRVRYPDREEVYQAGDVYYATATHMTFFEAGCEYVEFSPTLEKSKATETAREFLEAQAAEIK